MIVYYSEFSMFVVGDYVPKWLPKWASQLKTIMSDLRLRHGNFPFQNRKGCELGLYTVHCYCTGWPRKLLLLNQCSIWTRFKLGQYHMQKEYMLLQMFI